LTGGDILKKALIMLFVSVFVLIGCSGGSETSTENTEAENPPQNTEHENKQESERENTQKIEEVYTLGTPIEKDGVSITITDVKVTDKKGDRTKDNYAQENGEYFALGSDIVKASDYEQIEVGVKVENKSDKAISFSSVGWSAKLPDGYELENIEVTGKLDGQIASNYAVEEKIIITKEKAIKADKMTLTYNFMDYNEEWRQAFWKLLSGEFDVQEYQDKFNPYPMDFILELN